MLVRMQVDYQGYLNQNRHFWQAGQEVEVEDEVGAELIRLDRAVEVVPEPAIQVRRPSVSESPKVVAPSVAPKVKAGKE